MGSGNRNEPSLPQAQSGTGDDETIRVLHLEDSDLDADFVQLWLQKAGLVTTIQRVADRDAFIQALQTNRYGVILSDYQVPTFEGLAALEIAGEHQPQTPFIFVSGTMGEELAVETLKRGATDYVLKDHLARLPAAVQRAVDEARARAERVSAQIAAQEANERAATILESITDAFFTLDHQWRFVYTNPQAVRTLRRDAGELLGKNIWHEFPELLGTPFERMYRRVAQSRVAESVTALFAEHACWYEARAFPSTEGLSVYFRDVSERVRAEEELSRAAQMEKQRSALLARVAQASRAINAVLSDDSIAQILTEEARSILGARAAVTSFTLGGQEVVQVRATAADHPPQDAAHAQRDRGHASVAADDDPQLARAASEQNRPVRVPRGPAGTPGCGRLAVPLVGHGGERLGVVQVADKLQGDFTAEDEAILVQLAAIAAVGIENARLYERVREQDQRKDEFLATLAHELRNPLAPIRTGLTVLGLATSPDELRSAREMMERQVGHMVRLIDDLLDVSRITRGKVQLKRQRIDLRRIIEAALEVTQPLITANQHELQIGPLDQPLIIDADPTRIAQVISNLLNNAAKYTPPGGRIELTAHREGGEVVVTVQDNGTGIEPQMLTKVFDMFTQVGRTIHQAQGGLGIGLALVARLVAMHGGSVAAHSEGDGQGSRFLVRLPLAPPAVAAGQSPPPVAAAADLRPRRILVVDDNVDGAHTLALLLRFAGHTTTTAHSGGEALETIKTFRPEVVFLDIGLPGMSGYDVAQQVRANPASKDLVLVALTGWGTEDDRRRAKLAGFDHHLTKPVDTARVQTLLAELPAGSR